MKAKQNLAQRIWAVFGIRWIRYTIMGERKSQLRRLVRMTGSTITVHAPWSVKARMFYYGLRFQYQVRLPCASADTLRRIADRFDGGEEW